MKSTGGIFMLKNRETRKKWPADCPWPEPVWDGRGGEWWDPEDVDLLTVDEETRELLEIRDYMEELTGEEQEEEGWEPEIGAEYWDPEEGFLADVWEEDFLDHINLLKIPAQASERDAVSLIREVIGYEFVNENLLRQAFTRRAFGTEYGVGDSETLEFLGDSILNAVVTREIARQMTEQDTARPQTPFRSAYDEGAMTKIRSHYVSKEYLAGRAAELGLDRFLLYGTGEQHSDSTCEDMMEALIGAVAVDSNWDQNAIEAVIDRLLCLQVMKPDRLLKKTYYDIFNAWHQRRFGCIPSYEVHGYTLAVIHCTIRFSVPENDRGIRTSQRIDVDGESRSKAREYAAQRAYSFVRGHGLWIDLRDAGITPSPENSINQLQELYQKKYLANPPVYEFEELPGDQWSCDCVCGDIYGSGWGGSKTKAKKEAAYMALVRLFKAAGISLESSILEIVD